MQAKHRSGFWGRRRSHLIGCAIGMVAIFALAMPSLASAVTTETYAALGDSVAFGYSSQLYHEGEAAGFVDPEGFENGYADNYVKSLNMKNKKAKTGKSFRLVNDGCPGETTETLIGENPVIIGTLNAALKKTQEEHGLPPVKGSNKENPEGQDKFPCEYQAAWTAKKEVGKGGPLHHPYPTTSQLEDAIKVIKDSASEKKPVTSVTLNIGANDELHALGKIEAETKSIFVPKYISEHEPTLKEEAAAEAFTHCVKKAEKETGESSGPAFEAAREACLAGEGEAYGKRAYEFKVGAAAEQHASEEISAAVPGLFAQISSNLLGIEVAIRKAGSLGFGGIDYGGKIMFQGGYNPFGKQFTLAFEGVGFVASLGAATTAREKAEKAGYAVDSGRCGEHAEKLELEEEAIAGGCTAAALHPGFNALVGVLSGAEEGISNGAGVCMTAPHIRFNPQNTKKPSLEPERLKKWTGMTNATRTKVGSEERFNGPDIHPTPAGYKELANEILKEEAKRCHTQEYPGF
jgi:hypothetical protein